MESPVIATEMFAVFEGWTVEVLGAWAATKPNRTPVTHPPPAATTPLLSITNLPFEARLSRTGKRCAATSGVEDNPVNLLVPGQQEL